MDCLSVPKKITYTVINAKTELSYLYVGVYEATKLVLSKVTSGKKLSETEEKVLMETYGENIIDEINNSKQVFLFFINQYDDIYSIKKKIVYSCCKNSSVNNLYLFSKKTKITDLERIDLLLRNNHKFDESNVYTTLGHKYASKNGPYYLHPFIGKKTIELDINDEFINENGHILGNYANLDNTIYFYDANEMVDLEEKVKDIYFPFIKKNNFTNNYEIIKNTIAKRIEPENYYEDISNRLDVKFDSCTIKNIIFKTQISYKNLDLQYIFDFIQLDEQICFSKYNNGQFKLFNKNNYQTRLYPTKDHFLKYEKNYYMPEITKDELMSFLQNKLTSKERQYLNDKLFIDNLYIHTYNNSFVLKVKFYDSYIEFKLNKEGELFVKCLEVYLDLDKQKELLKIVNTILNSISKLTKNPINKLSNMNNLEFIQCDLMYDIEKTNTQNHFKKIKTAINYFNHFFVMKPTDANNKIRMNYLKVNNYNNIQHLKQIFITLKETYNSKTVEEFKTIWLNTTEKLMGVSNKESLYYLTIILEEYSKNELKKLSLDFDVTIEIKLNFSESNKDNFTVSIEQANSLSEIALLRNHIEVIFFKATEIKKIIIPEEFEFNMNLLCKNNEFCDDPYIDDDVNLDLDLIDNYNENEEESEYETQNNIEPDKSDSEDNEDDELVKYDTTNMRNYMKNMRNLDKKLFKYKSSKKHTQFSIKCGSVDMRQPIIMTDKDMRNFESVNPVAYNEISKIEWGSSINAKNFYMCPRIYCIRDKIALTDNQLINGTRDGEPSETSEQGTCPYCKGGIIDSQDKIITETKTVIIRRAGSNKYWENPSKNKSDLWKKYLYETEKDAYPGFLDPKLHPNGMCMPCCNSNQNWNYSKCMINNVDHIKHTKTNDLLKDDDIKDGDTVLFSGYENNKKRTTITGIFKKKNNKWVPITEFTKLKIPLEKGMTFIDKNKNDFIYTYTGLQNDKMVFNKKKNINVDANDIYLLGEDKFPLFENKVGRLPKIVDTLLSNYTNDKINKDKNDRISKNENILVRIGSVQEINLSFLNALCKIMNETTERFIKKIIKNITPELFQNLNNGDIYRTFVNKNDNQNKIPNYKDKYNIWKSDEKNKSFVNSQSNQDEYLYQLFLALERFKNYLGDMNIVKDPIYFLDLVSRDLPWLRTTNLNIIIIERIIFNNGQEHLYIQVPQFDNIDVIYKDGSNIGVIYKYLDLYEPIIEISSNNYKLIPTSILAVSNIKKMLDTLKKHGSLIYDYKMVKHNLPTIKDVKTKYHDKIQKIVINNNGLNIGVLLKNQLAIFTHPFSNHIKIIGGQSTIHIGDLHKFKYKDLIKKLNKEGIKHSKFVLNNGVVDGLIVEGNVVYPIEKTEYKDGIEYEYYDTSSNEDPIIFNKNVELYNAFKKEFTNFFKGDSDHLKLLKEQITTLLENPIVGYTFKINKLYNLFSTIGNKILKSKSSISELNKSTFDFLSKQYTIILPQRKMTFSNKDYDVFLKKMASSFITNFNIRMEILENVYKHKKLDTNFVFYTENIHEIIKQLYTSTNFYTQNNIVSLPQKIMLKDIQTIYNDTKNSPPKQILATTITKNGIDKKLAPNTKAGKCIFPFKIEGETYIDTYNECKPAINKLDGNICATEVDEDGFLKSFGYCHEATKQVMIPKLKELVKIDGWDGPFKDTLIKNGSINKTQYQTLEAALKASKTYPECIGIIFNNYKKYYTLKDKRGVLVDRIGFYSYTKTGATIATKRPKPVPPILSSSLYITNKKTKKKKRIVNRRKTNQRNLCIIPFEHNDTLYTDCKPEYDGSSKCPTKKTKKSYQNYEVCEELEYDKDKLLKNYKILEDHKLHKGIIDKRKIMTLPRAIELANELDECKGVTWNNDKLKYTIHKTSNLIKEPGFIVYLKKNN